MEVQEGIRRQAQQRKDFAKNLASWADKKNKKDPGKETRKRKRDLPPIRGSINQKVEPKVMEDGEGGEENVARTKPLPAGVVCERHKIEGNNYFKRNEFELAIDSYSKAIKALPTNPIPWANRAMARLKQKQYKLAEKDCNECLKLDATYVKAYYRRGQSRQGLKKWSLAIEDFQQVLKLNSKDKNAEKMLVYCQKQLTKSGGLAGKKKATKVAKKKKKILIQMVDDDDEEEIVKRKLQIEEGEDSSDEEEACPVIPKKQTVVEAVNEEDVQVKPIEKSSVTIEEVQSEPINKEPKKAKQVVMEVLHEEEAPGFIPKTPEKTPVEIKKADEPTSPSDCSPYRRWKDRNSEPYDRPAKFFDFRRLWVRLGPEDRAELILSYDPETFPSLFGQCLSKEILASIIKIYAANIEDTTEIICAGLNNLTKVPRFGLLTMFMNGDTKKLLGDIWTHLEKNGSDVSVLRKKWS